MVQTIIFNAYDVETARMAVGTKGIMERVKGISPARIYRKQLRAYRRMAKAVDLHAVLSNIWIGGWVAAGIYLIFIHA